MIVAAAIKHDGKVWALPAPARHHDVIRLICERTGVKTVSPGNSEQGFIDSEEGFVGRKVALMLAHVDEQPMRDPRIYADQLFSENLW